MQAYCKRQGLQMDFIRFVSPEGERINKGMLTQKRKLVYEKYNIYQYIYVFVCVSCT